MVQLSLLGAEAAPTLAQHLQQVALQWTRHNGAGAHADAALRITEAHFASWSGRDLTRHECDRVAAYFGGVVRRRLMRGRDAESMAVRRHLVAASVEQDLCSAGWRREVAAEEARRVAGLSRSLGGAA